MSCNPVSRVISGGITVISANVNRNATKSWGERFVWLGVFITIRGLTRRSWLVQEFNIPLFNEWPITFLHPPFHHEKWKPLAYTIHHFPSLPKKCLVESGLMALTLFISLCIARSGTKPLIVWTSPLHYEESGLVPFHFQNSLSYYGKVARRAYYTFGHVKSVHYVNRRLFIFPLHGEEWP